jgi:hypothetical protein
MPKFAIYRSRLLGIPGSQRTLTIPGRPPTIHEDYRVQMEVVGSILAIDADCALLLAKRKGYAAPIIGPWKENMQ